MGFTVKHKKNSGMIVHSFTYTGDLAKCIEDAEKELLKKRTGASFEKYPLALALYTADMMASRLMEGEKENKQLFLPADPAPAGAAQEATPPAQEDAPPPAAEWQDAPPLQAGA